MFSEASVNHSVHREGERGLPSGRKPLPGQRPPPNRDPLPDRETPPRQVRILLEFILVYSFFSYEEIGNSYFLHYSVKSQAPFMSSAIKIDLKEKRRIYCWK